MDDKKWYEKFGEDPALAIQFNVIHVEPLSNSVKLEIVEKMLDKKMLFAGKGVSMGDIVAMLQKPELQGVSIRETLSALVKSGLVTEPSKGAKSPSGPS